MSQIRPLVSWVALLVSGTMIAGCGSAPATGATGGTSTATAASGGCQPGATGSATTLTVPAEPDSGVSSPTGKCWASIKPTPIDNVAVPAIPSGDSTTFQVAWSAKGLYIMSTDLEWPLSDAGGANWWQDDATEFAVSGADDHGGAYGPNTFQFGIDNGGTLDAGTNASTASPQPTAKVQINKGKGFQAELFVPWATLQVAKPAKGQVYQFNIAEDYGNASGARVGQALWASTDATFYNSTTNWGDITLG